MMTWNRLMAGFFGKLSLKPTIKFTLVLVAFLLSGACVHANVKNQSNHSSSLVALTSGPETFYENASGLPLIQGLNIAKVSIDIETYQMDDPVVQQALKAALARGVRVRVVEEDRPVGAACKVFDPALASDDASCMAQKEMLKLIRSSKGGAYVAFQDSELCGIRGKHCFEHGKMIIIDSKMVFVSTGNFNTSNLCFAAEHPTHCNRDYTVLSQDFQVVRELQTIFENDLRGIAYSLPSVIQSGSRKVTVSPYSMQPLIQLIDSAKKTIQIQNQYLNDPTLNEAILAAAKRGVSVYVMVSSACSFGRPKPGLIKKWTGIYQAFDEAGIHSKVFTRAISISGVQGYLHAKAILIDSALGWIGSVNGSTLSLTSNREFGIFLQEPAEVQKLATFMYRDFVDPGAETWQDSLSCKHDPYPTADHSVQQENDENANEGID